jgi:hypothetical protein
LLLTAFLFLAVAWCTWAPGASRLAAQADPPAAPVASPQALPAALEAGAVRESLSPSLAQVTCRYPDGTDDAPRPASVGLSALAAHSVPRDANGNVVLSRRYARAVYRAFAFGDMPG